MDNCFNSQLSNGSEMPSALSLARSLSYISTISSSSQMSPDVSFCNNSFAPNDLDASRRLFAQPLSEMSTADSTFWLGNIWDSLSQNDTKSRSLVSCSCDDLTEAEFYCRDCKEYLCQKCVSAHYRVNLTKKHNIVKASASTDFDLISKNSMMRMQRFSSPPHPDEAPSNKCTVHSNEVVNFYCDTCSSIVCTQCTTNEHNGHNFQYLHQVMEPSKNATQAILADAQSNLQVIESKIMDIQRMIERVIGQSKMVQSDIQTVMHKHMLAIKQRETELINKTEQIKAFKCRVLSSQMETLQSFAGKLKATIEATNDAMKSSNAVEVLAAKTKIQLEVNACPRSICMAEDEDISYINPNPTIFLALSSLGDVKSSVCAQQCHLSKDNGPSSTALCGSCVSFTIHARDHTGDLKPSRSGLFEVNVKKPDETVFRADVMDVGSGRYVFRVHFTMEGEYVVSARCRGVPICDSPYHIKVRRSVNYVTRAASGVPLRIIGKEGAKEGELCRPWGICCDAEGRLIVADRSNNRLQIFNPDGTVLDTIGSAGTRPGQFDRPAGVAVDNKGHIVVADKDNHRIQIFSFDGKFVRAFGERGSKNGQFNYPWDVDVSSHGLIAVTDTRNHRVQLFSFEGKYLRKYGFEGAMWKHFDSPRGVAFTQDNRLVVTDFNNHRLVIIQPDMLSARYLGSEGSQSLQFLRPQGVAVDVDGNIVVADSRNHRLQVFTLNGTLVAVFGGINQSNAFYQMDRPSGVTVTPNGHIAVVDFGNNRIMVF